MSLSLFFEISNLKNGYLLFLLDRHIVFNKLVKFLFLHSKKFTIVQRRNMAEPTCVMHPFSYTTPTFSNETHEENPMCGIGESVSFGRYVCEELEWEKWSSFDSNNRNRYVKEAEKYSKPGSVAQKKAYFEAHFKRMAALKAAGLLEQANGAENTSSENFTGQVNDVNSDDGLNISSNLQVEISGYEQEDIVPKEGEKSDAGEFAVHQNELYLIGVDDEENGNDGKEVIPPPPDRKPDKIELYSASKKGENCKASNEKACGILQMDKPVLKKDHVNKEVSAAVIKRNPPLSSYIPSPARSANVIHPGKENYATPVKNKSYVGDPDKKKTPLRMTINRELNRIMSPVIKKLGSSSKASKDCATAPSKTPAKASVNSIPQVPPMTLDLSKRGISDSPSTDRNKISSPIIPNSFCLRSGDRTARRKQKLEDKFNATATEKAPQPLKFKEKAEAELNKFRQSFCFKSMSSPDYYGDNGRFSSPKQKKESTHQKSPSGGKHASRTTSLNKTALPPRRPSVKQIGLKSTKRTTLIFS